MRKIVLTAIMLLALVGAKAQTNIQEMYDFNRGHFTTTLEMFKSDPWGSTFFFTDIYHNNGYNFPTDFYTEIARSLNFWHNSSLKDLSLHVEWNGGNGVFSTPAGLGGYGVNNAWLYGVEYCFHDADFSKTLTLEAMYKDIRGGSSKVPMQLTAVWGLTNIFGVKGLDFSGFADFWWEDQTFGTTATSTIFLSEPQLWYNVGQHFACKNLMVGGEVEIANNFAGTEGWAVRPCLGMKWAF